MSVVSVTLQKSMARGLDVVSSVTQQLVMIAGLLFLLGVASIVFKGSESSGSKDGHSAASILIANALALDVIAQSVPTTRGAGILRDTKASSLTPGFTGALEYIKRRYRVSPEAVLPVFETAESIGRERSIDPLLILAIIGIESGFNPFAESSMGARGLMQVIPRFHMDKLPKGKDVRHLFDPAVNIQVGVLVLEEAIRRHGDLVAGLQSYAGSSDIRKRYANKVLNEKARLEKAAQAAQAAQSARNMDTPAGT